MKLNKYTAYSGNIQKQKTFGWDIFVPVTDCRNSDCSLNGTSPDELELADVTTLYNESRTYFRKAGYACSLNKEGHI